MFYNVFIAERAASALAKAINRDLIPGGLKDPESTFQMYLRIFLDEVASLGSMLESESVSDVFEIWSTIAIIFQIASTKQCHWYSRLLVKVGSQSW